MCTVEVLPAELPGIGVKNRSITQPRVIPCNTLPPL